MALKSLNDSPVLLDDFGLYTPFVKDIAEEIRHSQAPKTIAITGYWGSGKTSVLAQLYRELFAENPPTIKGEAAPTTNNNPHYQGVWFEAWRYQHEPQPIIALMHTMRQSFSRKRHFFDQMGKITSVSMVAGLSVFDSVIKTLSAGTVSGLDKIQAIGEKYEKDHLLSQLSTDQINNALSTAIDHLLTDKSEIDTNDDRKCIIFIDDLDRCDAQTAKKLLEGIKVHLNLDNCIFVIAIDPAQLEASFQIEHAQLRNTAKREDASNHDATEYLEKLCQDAHRLPIASQKQIVDFVATNLIKIVGDDHLIYGNIIAAIQLELEQKNYLPANPRRLKMFCNRLAAFIHKTINEEKVEGYNEQRHAQSLIFLASTYVSYREIYEMLSVSANSINDVSKFSKDGKSDMPAFKHLTNGNTKARGTFIHPNKITEFRFTSLLTEIEAQDNLPAWGDYLHKLIQSYNAAAVIEGE